MFVLQQIGTIFIVSVAYSSVDIVLDYKKTETVASKLSE